MKPTLRDSFEQHSQHYRSRVRNRQDYKFLSVEDNVVVDMVNRNWLPERVGTLIDAGCGTGDRLHILFTQQDLPFHLFNYRIGIDFSAGMLHQAQKQTVRGRPLYDQLILGDLKEKPDKLLQGDLILCQWSVLNNNWKSVPTILYNLVSMLQSSGLLVFDVTTTRAERFLKPQEYEVQIKCPELRTNSDSQIVWYGREDRTIARLRMFSPAEINVWLRQVKAQILEIWGYRHNELLPARLAISHGILGEEEASQYETLIFLIKRK